jgi:hypothetical protein
LVPEIGTQRPAFVLRFGYAPAPSGKTGRLPIEAVVDRAARHTATSMMAPSSSR